MDFDRAGGRETPRRVRALNSRGEGLVWRRPGVAKAWCLDRSILGFPPGWSDGSTRTGNVREAERVDAKSKAQPMRLCSGSYSLGVMLACSSAIVLLESVSAGKALRCRRDGGSCLPGAGWCSLCAVWVRI